MDKILIVDDSFADRTLLREMLQSSNGNFDIRDAESGWIAFEMITSALPDLILLDINMKEMDGFAFLEELNQRRKLFLPVLLVSSFTGEDDRLKGVELGATDFINKPLVPEEVVARVAAQLKIKKMHEDSQWIAEKTNEAIKTLYKELEKKNEELTRLDQLKSDFVSTVSHELRTPLAIIRQGISLMHRKVLGDVNDQQLEILTDVLDGSDRLINIINDILYHVIWAEKKIKRGELWVAVTMINNHMSNQLLKLIEANNQKTSELMYDGRYLETRTEQNILEKMGHCFTKYDSDDASNSLQHILELTRMLSSKLLVLYGDGSSFRFQKIQEMKNIINSIKPEK